MKVMSDSCINSFCKSFFSIAMTLTLIICFNLFAPDSAESATLKASTSMTVMNVTKWKAPESGDMPLSDFSVKAAKITGVSITWSQISWRWENGLQGLLWAFWTDDSGKTYTGWGWDYVTPGHTSKHLEGYKRGWVGTAVGTCAACNGHRQRTNIFFTDSY